MTDKSALIREAWIRGRLAYKLKPVQKIIYDRIQSFLTEGKSLEYVLNCSRRLGKSYTLSLIAIEHAIRKPGAEVRFAAPTMKALKRIILPNFRRILSDCPKDLRPTWKAADLMWVFPNGSIIDISGANSGHAENLRGTAASLALVDEAGTITELDYLLRDILMPQLVTTDGKILIASTPPRRRAKEFKELCIKAEMEGCYSKFTINDATHIPKEKVELYKKECGGEQSPVWNREYLACFDVNEEIKVTPSFHREIILPNGWKQPKTHEYMDKYESFDYGRTDAFVTLFAHWNPNEKSLYVEDELKLINEQVTPSQIKEGIAQKESALGYKTIFKRTSDGAHLIDIPGKEFTPVIKGRLDEMVGKLNDWLTVGKIRIDPRCKFLISCLEYGEWNAKREQFARSEELLHLDATAALVYMVLGIEEARNPIPKDLDPITGEKRPITLWKPSGLDPLGLKTKKGRTLPSPGPMGYTPIGSAFKI